MTSQLRYDRSPKGLVVRRRIREKKRARLADLKSGPCMGCGNTFPPECMDFDHVRGVKHERVGLMVYNSEETLAKEIAKCDLVCANCHRTRTHARRVACQI